MSETADFRRANCRLCGADKLKAVLKLSATPSGDAYVSKKSLNDAQQSYPLDLVLCPDCGHSQLSIAINPEILYSHYIYTTSISLGLADHFSDYVREMVSRLNIAKSSLIIDIGSNDGTLLKFFKKEGMKTLGVEPAKHLARKATESGIETLPNFFSSSLAAKIKKNYGCATVVTANNVFANIDDLRDVIQGIRNLLSPEGVFIFETSYLLDVIQKGLIETFFHEHISYFSVKPLQAFFRNNGMELIDAQRISSKGGSVRCTVKLSEGKRKVSKTVSELISLEESAGIHYPEAFMNFSNKMSLLREKLHVLLDDIKSKRQNLAGYGASVGVTTLLYHFDLVKWMEFLADDNPARQGLFSPGYHIPVLSPQAIYDKKIKYVLILAWGYAEPIINKHQDFLRRGGHFIVPLPELKII